MKASEKNMFNKNKQETIEPIIELGLEKLDENSLDIINKMLQSHYLTCWKFKPSAGASSNPEATTATTAIYNQNYIILKQLLNLQEQNQQIIQQNQQIIELLTEIKNK